MANALSGVPRIANGNINPASIVKTDTSRDNAVIQATATTDVPAGISQLGPYYPPGAAEGLGGTSSPYAAVQGQQVMVFLPGDVTKLRAGSAAGWTAGDLITAGPGGYGVTATTGNWCIARAIQAVAANEWGDVEVIGPTKA